MQFGPLFDPILSYVFYALRRDGAVSDGEYHLLVRPAVVHIVQDAARYLAE